MTATTTDLKIGIIGIGNMGTAQAKQLVNKKIPGAQLAAIADLNPERFKEFPDVPAYEDPYELIALKDLDGIIVATPHYDHVPLGIASLEAGHNTLVEKPIAVHKQDAEKLVAAGKVSNKVFAAMFNQRTDPKYQWLKAQLDSGVYGPITRITWIITTWFRSEAYYRNGTWRATWSGEGGGVLLNQCPHQLDLWQWLFGMPTSVRAFCKIGAYHNIEVEDSVTAVMEYADGPTGTFITTTGEAPGTNRLEIAADRARIILEGNTVTVHHNAVPTSEFSQTTDELFGTPPKACSETRVFEGEGEQHAGILKNFAAAIRGEAKLIAPAGEGLRSVELGNSMLYSGLMNETVELPLDAPAYAAQLQKLIAESTFVKKAATPVAVQDMSASFRR